MEIHHSVIGRLMQCLQATEMVDERPRFDRPRKTTHRDNMLVARFVRRNRFTTSARIRDELNFAGHVSVTTANRRLHCHYVIDGLDGLGHVTISIGMFVFGNRWSLLVRRKFGGGGVAVWVFFSFNCKTYISYKVTVIALHTATTCLIIH